MNNRQNPPSPTRNPPWYLLTGLILGLLAGLIYTLAISPAHYVNTSPRSLREEFKEHYRNLISLAYQSNGDFQRARARLALLGDSNPGEVLSAQAQRYLAEGKDNAEAQALARLAEAFTNQVSIAQMAQVKTPTLDQTVAAISNALATAQGSTPLAGSPPPPTETPLPPWIASPTPEGWVNPNTPDPSIQTPTQPTVVRLTQQIVATPLLTLMSPQNSGPAFILKDKNPVCDPELAGPLLQVEVRDRSGEPVAGVKILVTWENGEDTLMTGLYPQVSPGYADYEMTPGKTYSLRVRDDGEPVIGLRVQNCITTAGAEYWGGLYLDFAQP